MTATYPAYLACIETLLQAPAALEGEQAAVEAEFEAARRIASGSLEVPKSLAFYAARRIDAYLIEGRELLDAAQLATLLPAAIRPAPVATDSTPSDISVAEAAVAHAVEALRLAVLRHHQLARQEADGQRRARAAEEARRQAEELVRREAARLALARVARRRRLLQALAVGLALILTALVVLILR